jgi:crotonobetainyl-CoA:carnitine CoA-transferase CaiB-like acyl-CoA transferase
VQPMPDSAMKCIGLPLSFDRQRSMPRARPPGLGEHTEQIFTNLE